jgi:hypothetical protein
MKLPQAIKFTISILILTILLYVSGLLVYKNFPVNICFFNYYTINLFLFLIINLIFLFIIINIPEQKPKKIFFIYLLLTTFKIFIYITFIIIILFSLRQGIICFLLSFLILYFVYTIHEILYILKFAKNKK